ncbi:MAG: hypothetical protein L6420_06810 [Elusimicrobia bacterium]|nr:hypothetical protein [Elusimicrobiota bacterium]
MRKSKSLFLSIIVLSFSLTASGVQSSSDFNLNQTYDWLSIIADSDSSIKLDINSEIKPSSNLDIKNDSKGFPVSKLYIGRDISPKISDEGRVKGILELIRKIVLKEKLPFKEDGSIFNNREGLLPDNPVGFYKEYTFVPPKNSPKYIMIGEVEYEVLPSISKRGSERLVIGGDAIVYYTPTHYADFIRLEIIK